VHVDAHFNIRVELDQHRHESVDRETLHFGLTNPRKVRRGKARQFLARRTLMSLSSSAPLIFAASRLLA
jgi:hypothetical protein